MLARSMLRWNTVLSGLGDDDAPPFAVGVVDEADRLPRVAADVFTVKPSISTLRALARSIPGTAGRNLLRAVDEAGDRSTRYVRRPRASAAVTLKVT